MKSGGPSKTRACLGQLIHVGGEGPKSVTPIVTVATSRLSSFLGSGTLSERMSPLLHAKPPGREPLNQSPPGSDVPGNIDLLARTLLSGGIRPALATLLSYDAYPNGQCGQWLQRSFGGLCVEVVVPVSLWFLFSIPVGLDDDGRGLCVELVLPIHCPAEEFEAPPSPLVSSAKDIVLGPAKRMRATTAARILWGIKTPENLADATPALPMRSLTAIPFGRRVTQTHALAGGTTSERGQ